MAVRPAGRLHPLVDEIYYRVLSKARPGRRVLEIQACFQVAHGSHKRREAMLWQKIDATNDYAALKHLLTTDIPAEHRGPGTYMFDALKYRDQWRAACFAPPRGHRCTDDDGHS